MTVRAEVLGGLRVVVNGRPVDLGGPRQRRLLGSLLVERGSTVSTDRLVENVFDGDPPRAASRTFRTYVARLRRAFDVAGVDGARLVITEPRGYALATRELEVDADEFEQRVESGRDCVRAGEHDRALVELDAALGLWSGVPYGELADLEWARVEVARLGEMHRAAQELRVEALLEAGDEGAALPQIAALIESDPHREGPRRLHLLALYRSGRHAEALRAAREYRRFLAEDTGLEPTRELDDLERMIVAQDPRLDRRPAGRKLRGYVVGAPIAESDLGITYRAHQPAIDRDVAITAIPSEQADDSDFVRRFEVHAQRIASIEHPNVLPLYDYWREPGAAYLVSRYVAGGSLDRRLADGPLEVEQRWSVLHQVASGLVAAHERGVVHGRLAPSSVLLDESGSAYVTGFATRPEVVGPRQDARALAEIATALWAADEADRAGSQAVGTVQSTITQVATAVVRGDVTVDSVPEVVDLLEEVAGASAADTAIPVRTIEGPNPFRGLFSFAETDADVFFGRDRLTDEVVSGIQRHPFVAVVGPSGSGKSSLVLAGVLPRLRADGAYVATMTPGSTPFAELALALVRVAAVPVPDLTDVREAGVGLGPLIHGLLPDAGGSMVLLVDQFEELYVQSTHEDRERFLAVLDGALDEMAGRLRVVVTVRADYLGRALDDPGVGERIRERSVLVTPLSAEDMHEAIVGPAETAGVAVEPALVTALVSDAREQPGSLPLLQFALTELYERRTDGTMTLDEYHRLGGLGAVLAQRAEEIFSGLGPDDQLATRGLFGRLVDPGGGSGDTRRRARRRELAAVSDELLARFTDARLLAVDRDPETREPTVEVAHEALLREWPRLRRWIADDRDDARLVHRLTIAADEWEANDRDGDLLYRGARLESVDEWEGARGHPLSTAEQAFVDASRTARDQRRAVERRRVRRLRTLLGVTALVAVVAIVAGLVAFAARRTADDNAREADLRRLMAESQTAAADEPSRALLLALEAYRLEPSTEKLGAVQAAVVGGDPAWLGDIANGKEYRRVAFLPDGTLVAVNEVDLEVWDLDVREVVRSVPTGVPTNALDVSTDGRLLALGDEAGTWRVLDAASLAERATGRAGAGVAVIRIDPNQRWLAVGRTDGIVEVHDLGSGGPPEQLNGVDTEDELIGDPVSDLAFRPDGARLAVAWAAGHLVQQWPVPADGAEGTSYPGTERAAQLVVYDGDVLVTVFGLVYRFDSETGEQLGEPFDRRAGLDSPARLYVDGPRLTIAGPGLYEVVDLDRGEVERRTAVASGSVSWGADRSADGRILAQGTVDGIQLWATDGAGLFVDAVVPAAPDPTQINHITTDGRTVVQGGNVTDGVPTRIYEISDTGAALVHEVEPGWGARASGRDVYRYGREGDDETKIGLWRWDGTSDFEHLLVTERVTFGFNIPVLTPTGEQVLHGWNNGQPFLDVFDVASGERRAHLTEIQDVAGAVESYALVPTFGPDGRRLVFPTAGQYVGVYDPTTWELIEILTPDEGFQEIVFGPDGERAITLSVDGLEIRDADDLSSVLLGPVPLDEDPSLGRALEITEDGRYLKTGGLTGAQLWDPETLEPIGSPFPNDEDAWAATLATETNQLAATVDGTTYVWDIDLDSWLDRACLAAGRNLTRAEWDELGPRGDYHVTCDRWPSG